MAAKKMAKPRAGPRDLAISETVTGKIPHLRISVNQETLVRSE